MYPLRQTDTQNAQMKKNIGPALPIKMRGKTHWGWFLSFRTGVVSTTICGMASKCCGTTSKLSAAPVNCKECLTKAKTEPNLIKGQL